METNFLEWGGKGRLPPYMIPYFYKKMIDIVVILKVRKHKYVLREETYELEESYMHGGGVVVSPEGHILTAYHVIEDAVEIHFRTTQDSVYDQAVYIAGDRGADIAIIKLADKANWNGNVVKYASFAQPSTIYVGMEIISIACPGGICHTFSTGQLGYPSESCTDETDCGTSCLIRTYGWRRAVDCFDSSDPDIDSYAKDLSVLQISNAHGSPGTSGGAIFNSSGFLVGLHVFTSRNFDFAVHVTYLKRFVDEVFIEEVARGLRGSQKGPRSPLLDDKRKEGKPQIGAPPNKRACYKSKAYGPDGAGMSIRMPDTSDPVPKHVRNQSPIKSDEHDSVIVRSLLIRISKETPASKSKDVVPKANARDSSDECDTAIVKCPVTRAKVQPGMKLNDMSASKSEDEIPETASGKFERKSKENNLTIDSKVKDDFPKDELHIDGYRCWKFQGGFSEGQVQTENENENHRHGFNSKLWQEKGP